MAACAVLAALGCGKDGDSPEATTTTGTTGATTGASTASEPKTAAGVDGTYTMEIQGQKMTLELAGGNFTMTNPAGVGKGTFTHSGDTVTLNVTETDGKPASEKDKASPLVLKVGADGSLSGSGMSFKKG